MFITESCNTNIITSFWLRSNLCEFTARFLDMYLLYFLTKFFYCIFVYQTSLNSVYNRIFGTLNHLYLCVQVENSNRYRVVENSCWTWLLTISDVQSIFFSHLKAIVKEWCTNSDEMELRAFFPFSFYSMPLFLSL